MNEVFSTDFTGITLVAFLIFFHFYEIKQNILVSEFNNFIFN